MTTQQMQEIQKNNPSNQGNSNQGNSNAEALDSRSIKSIQLADGWHNVSQCQVIPFSVGNSPVYQYFPTLKYKNQGKQTVYTPLKQILGFSETESSSAID